VRVFGLYLRAFGRYLLGVYRGFSAKTRRRLLVAAAVALALAPIWSLNTAVAFFGNSIVFPLSPFFLKQKLAALGSYATHRPFCLLRGHPEIDPLIAHATEDQRLPRGLLAAVVQVESGGRPHRISCAGAMGPTQLMPDTARALGVGDPFDSQASVDGAARLLAQHLARFHRVRLALAAYHAGPGAVRGGRVPDNGETVEYVTRVMKIYDTLRPHRRPRRPVPEGLPRVPGPLLVSGTW
jgi:soluble lytic murein transglycosylase-like protein